MVVQAKARLKKWGNSLGIVIPKAAADKNGLRVGDEVEILLTKQSDITELRGRYPVENLQAAKEGMRKGWRD
ncbi:MAG: AbrB/MazE/SpoVT family DNA-binding domain-containing protein [Nitrososphaerales archaeon]|jgi:antitoxin component of MazEF toxin-antitoxin module